MLCKNKSCKKGNFDKRAKFKPERIGQVCCSVECAIELIQSKTYVNQREKEIRVKNVKEKKILMEKMKTRTDYLNELQKIFNQYIRLRDKNENCISCNKPTRAGNEDAGHFYPTTYSYLRFNEDNVFKQCSRPCNKDKHGNIAEYRPNLIKKIGIERVTELDNTRHLRLELSIDEIKEMTKVYKNKCSELK